MNPMLAGKTDGTNVQFPVLVSPKLDGIRMAVHQGKALSRSLKPIPNQHVQALFASKDLNGLDGELIVGDPTAKDCYRVTDSQVMTRAGTPRVTFHVFDDRTQPNLPFLGRYALLENRVEELRSNIQLIPHVMIWTAEDLLAYEARVLAAGYEGVMLRHPQAPYKFGRSTDKQGWLLKLKRFVDGEVIVLGATELQHNQNTAMTNELGYKKRSSHKAGKVGSGMLGALIVQDIETGVIFEIGTGFDLGTRLKLWQLHLTGKLVDAIVKYKHFPIGAKERPRHPVFLGFRSLLDL